MRRFSVIALVVFVALSFAQGQEAKGLAVLDFKVNGIQEEFAGSVIASLVIGKIDPDDFFIVERSQIDMLLREKLYQAGNTISEEDVKSLRSLKISYVMLGVIAKVEGKFYGNYRVVDVNNGKISIRDSIFEANSFADFAKRTVDSAVAKLGSDNGPTGQEKDGSRLKTDWYIDTPTTLEVGPGKQFSNIRDAWNSLSGKVLNAEVKIQVCDGFHSTHGIWIQNHPYAHLVRIEGNVKNPDACVILFTPDVNKISHGVCFSNVSGINFSGFKLIGSITDDNYTYRCIHLDKRSQVFCDNHSIKTQGGYHGVVLRQGSRICAHGLNVRNAGSWSVVVGSSSHAEIGEMVITGPGKAVDTQFPKHVDPNQGKFKTNGILVYEDSTAFFSQSKITGVEHGVHCTNSSYCVCDVTVIDQVRVGFYAHTGGVIWASSWGDRRSQVTNADSGYTVDFGGIIHAPGAIAENCHQYGFYAAAASHICANNGWAKNCSGYGYFAGSGSEIEAWRTESNTTGCGTAYHSSENSLIRKD